MERMTEKEHQRWASPAFSKRAVARFNLLHPVGCEVRYWPGVREGDGIQTTTRSEAQMLGEHTAVVWVEGHGACIALSHVEPLTSSFRHRTPEVK